MNFYVILQPRDRGLLAQLHRFGVLSSGQIQKTIFTNINHSTVMRRLRKLEKGNFILRVKGLPDNESAWSLSLKSAQRLGEEKPQKYQNQNTTLHEVTLSEVRLVLESIGLGADFISETSLRQQDESAKNYRTKSQSNIPDGIFVADMQGTPAVIAVELELHPKNHARYQKVFSDYATKSAIRYVWYLVDNHDIARATAKVWREIYRREDSPELLVTYTDEFFRDRAEAGVWSIDGQTKRLGDYFTCALPSAGEDAIPQELPAQNPRSSHEQVSLIRSEQS